MKGCQKIPHEILILSDSYLAKSIQQLRYYRLIYICTVMVEVNEQVEQDCFSKVLNDTKLILTINGSLRLIQDQFIITFRRPLFPKPVSCLRLFLPFFTASRLQAGTGLLTYLSVIFSKGVQKFAQKCQYLTLIDQSVPLDNFYITFYFRTNQRWAGISVFQLDPIAIILKY